MPRTRDDDEEEEDEWSSDEDDDDSTVPCPYCRREIFEDSVRCPHCENYLSGEDAPPRRRSWWIIVGVALCLGLVFLWTVGR